VSDYAAIRNMLTPPGLPKFQTLLQQVHTLIDPFTERVLLRRDNSREFVLNSYLSATLKRQLLALPGGPKLLITDKHVMVPPSCCVTCHHTTDQHDPDTGKCFFSSGHFEEGWV
jgi:hypothetical protein